MKRLLSLLFFALSLASNVHAQAMYNEFPITVSNGLPGDMLISQYYWDSPTYYFKEPIDGIRITFLENNKGGSFNNFPMIALAELTFYDEKYNTINYSEADITTNSLERSEGALRYLCDEDMNTYYHSAWKYAVYTPEDYVYIDVKFPHSISSLNFTMTSRNTKLAPTKIVLTPAGVAYNGYSNPGGSDGKEENGGDASVTMKPIDVFSEEVLYVHLKDGGIDAFQKSLIDGDSYTGDGMLYIPLVDGDVVTYSDAEYDSCSTTVPQLPTLQTYKFNNKYNANLNVDVEAVEISDTLSFSLNAIGKSLTASFNLSDDRAVAYVDTTLQISKESRNRFDKPIFYTVTYPGYNIVQNVKVKDEIWDYGEDVIEEIPLTADMLATNKPSEVGDDLANMLDGNPSTVFHTLFGANYDATVTPYITVTLDNSVEAVKLYYQARITGNYNPLALNLYVSDNGTSWKLVKEFTSANDNLPMETGAEYTSPVVELGGSYRFFKLEQTASEYHNNHMVFAEFRMYSVTPGNDEPVKVQEAEYKNVRMPFGRTYTVDVDWLTDKQGAVPRIDIEVEGGYQLIHYDKETYRNAKITITGYGVYDDFVDSVSIKGRGNSTWGYSKKPYRLKFDKKKKPFGLTNGKSWVLLANAQKGAMMANAIAMKVGQLSNTPYANHIIPVELYMDGKYMGSYMFTEHVGFSNNSVDIDEDLGTGYMIELDDYYDEDYKFKSDSYNLPANIKEPDLGDFEESEAMEKFYNIQGDFNRFETSLYNGSSIERLLDLDAAARFMLTNDLVLNQELGHPKSTYLWREDMTSSSSKIVLGPLWDFDWGFGYESASSYCYVGSTNPLFNVNSVMYGKAGFDFFTDLMNRPEFKKHYYKVWKEFVERGCLQELCEYIDDYYNFAKSSFENNYDIWYDRITESDIQRMQQWLKERHEYIVANLDKEDITELIYTLVGDVDCNNYLTVHDVAIAADYVAGNTDAAFNFVKADIDKNNKVDVDDISNIASQVAVADAVSSLYYYNTPMAGAGLECVDTDVMLDETATLPIIMEEFADDTYKAIQMDITVPSGILLLDAEKGERTADASMLFTQIGENVFRVVVYSEENLPFAAGNTLLGLKVSASQLVPEAERALQISNILAVTENNREERIGNLNASFSVKTGLQHVEAVADIRGGESLTITTLAAQTVDIYSVDGRKVKSLNVSAGTTTVSLPAGIYIVNGQKVIIR